MYTHLAHLYDWPGSVDFADAVLAMTLSHLGHHAILPPSPILDLACGTGAVTVALAQQGYTVTGLDASPTMIGEAQHRAKNDGLQPDAIRWMVDDMRHFTLTHPVAAVTCFSDSLNHLLSEEDLMLCLTAVHSNLAHGGWLLFDLNTHENYTHLWQGEDTDTGETATLHFIATYDEVSGSASTRIEAHDTATGKITIDRVTEQFYPNNTVDRLLQQVGFNRISVEPFSPLSILPDDMPLKTLWRCQKP